MKVNIIDAVERLYRHKGYRLEAACTADGFLGLTSAMAWGLFSKKGEARVCLCMEAASPSKFSIMEKDAHLNRIVLEQGMRALFEEMDQPVSNPWLWDVHFDCLTLYEYKDDQVLCRLHMDIDEDMEV